MNYFQLEEAKVKVKQLNNKLDQKNLPYYEWEETRSQLYKLEEEIKTDTAEIEFLKSN